MVAITDRVKKVEYAIRDVVLPAKKLEKQGKKILYLNIGDPNYYDFDTPKQFKEALYEAINEHHNGYSDSQGVLQLRKAIAKREKNFNRISLSPDDIFITSGVSEAIGFLLAALINPGDEFLVPGPTYPSYIGLTKYNNGVPVPYRTIEEEDWKPDVDDIEKKITRRTKAILIINPNNPTGAVYDEEAVREIVNIASSHNLVLVSDEIYDQIVFDTPYRGTASIAKDASVVVFNGFSKVYIMPGWRIGYTYIWDPEEKLTELKDAIARQARIRICANSPIQYALAKALEKPLDYLSDYVTTLKKRRDFAWKRLNEIDGLSCAKPKGAFYAFPKIENLNHWKTDKDFVLDLLMTKQVLFVHGSGFDEVYGKGHFRTVFLPPIELMEEAFNRLEEFMNERTK